MLKHPLAVLASLVSMFALTRGHAQDATGGDETLLYKDGVFYRVHTFTDHENPGSFTVGGSDLSNVDYLIVAGGGGGGNGGGGGGGMLAGTFSETLGANQVYTVTVGDGGDGNVGHDDGSIKSDDPRRDGENSSITGGSLSVYEAIGGGAGGFGQFAPGNSGGSGGGASYDADSTTVSAASGVSGQGSAGGIAWAKSFGGSGGGGGAGEAGSNSVERVGNFSKGGKGGDGLSSDITGSDVTYAGGGAGGSVIPDANTYDIPSGGAGGGGSGPSTDAGAGGQGTDGLGGGGGGGEAEVRDTPELYTSGGSGIVILRYDITSAVLGNSTLVVEGDSLDDDGNLNADETSTATIKVQLKDANGVDLTISDATVVIETDYGSVSTTENEGNGLYTATLTAPSTPGDANISAKLDGVTIGATETVTFEDYNSPVFNSVNPNYDYTDGANHFYRYENVSGLLSTFTATDDFGPITYSMKQFKGGFETWHEVSNEDDYDFSIDADSGGLSFKNLQNYEDPSDNLNAVDDQFYRVEVTATDGGGNSVSEQVFVYIFDTEVPNAPTELNIAAGSGSLDLTWKAPDFDGTSDFRTLANNGSAITGYQVSIGSGDFVDVDEGDSSYVYDGDTGIFSYSLDQLENGTEYTIGLRAKNDDYADHVSGTYGAPNAYEDANIVTASGTPVSTPAAPAIDTVVASDKTLTINFTAGSLEGGTFVKYEAATNSAFTENLVEETTEGTASIAIPNLTNGTPYTVYLRAVSDVGNGAYAESADHKPMDVTFPTWEDDHGNAGDVVNTYVDENFVGALLEVAGSDNSGDDLIFNFIENGNHPGDPNLFAIVDNTDTSNVDDRTFELSSAPNVEAPADATADNIYIFDMGITDSAGNTSSRRHQIWIQAVREPAQPTGLQVTPGPGDKQLTLSWNEVTTDAVNKVLYRDSGIGTSNDGKSAGTYISFEGNQVTKYYYSLTAAGASSAAVTGELMSDQLVLGTASVTINDLDYDTTYEVDVWAENLEGQGVPAENTGTAAGPPDAPTGLTATQDDGELHLTWTPPTDTGGLSVTYEYSDDGGTDFLSMDTVTDNLDGTVSYTVTGLTNGVTAELQVRAVSNAGNSDPTESYFITPASSSDNGTAYDSTDAATCWPILATDANVTLTGAPSNSDDNGNYVYSEPLTFSFTSPLDLVLAPSGLADNWNFHSTSSYVTGGDAWVHTLGTFSVTYTMSGDGKTIGGAQTDADAGNQTWGHFDSANTSSLVLTPFGTDTFRICRLPEVPDMPTDLKVDSVGDGQLTLSWEAPIDDGGPDISAYQLIGTGGAGFDRTVAVADLSVDEDTGVLSYTVDSLTNGQPYDVQVRAVNTQGNGAITNAGAVEGTPVGLPTVPTIVSVVASDETLTINFTAGSLEGGTFVKYQAATNAAFTENLVEETTEGTESIAIANLTNGTPYTVYLRAVSDVGNGAYADSASHAPAATPSAPTIVSVVASDKTLTINFTAGSLEGGTFVKYQAATNAAFTENLVEETTEGAGSIAIPNLTNGTPYTVYLRAVSDIGDGTYAESPGHTPISTPVAPTIVSVVASDETLTINFTAGSLEGGTFVKYQAATNAAFTENLVEETTEGTGSIAIANLTNGTPYTVYLRAVSDVGNGAYAESASHAPAATPSAPTIDSVVASDKTLTINFTAGSLEGGTFVKYQAATNAAFTENLVEETTEGAGSIAIANLTNGTPYTVYLRAVSDIGDGTYAESPGHTPISTPVAPTIVSVVASDETLTINFTAGSLEGGTFVKYQAATNAAFTENLVEETTEGTGSIAIANLTNGTPYTVYLRAVSDVGNGAYAESASHAPAATPSAPTIDSVVASDKTLTINFTAGSLEGGTFVKYQAATNSAFTENLVEETTEGAGSIAISNLTNGTSYTVYLRAISDVGDGTYAESPGHMPVSTPAAPTIDTVTASDKTLTINFTAGSLEGGTFVKYQAATNTAFTENLVEETTEGAGSIAIANLTNGTSYTVYLRAVSDVGDGTYAESPGHTPAVTPAAPTIDTVVASDKTLTINFTAGSLEGGTFVKYQAATNSAFTENLVEETTEGVGSIAISNLTNGTSYTVYLRAISDVGDGTYAESPGHTPVSTPAAPTIASVVASDETLTINFTAGSLEGGTFEKYQAATDTAFTQNLAETATEGATSLAITGLTNGTSYTVYLRAVSDIGNGDYAQGSGTPTYVPVLDTEKSTVQASATNVDAGGNFTVTVTLVDTKEAAMTGQNVTVTGTIDGSVVIEPATATEGTDGTYTTGSLSTTFAGQLTLSAKVDDLGLNNFATVTVAAGPVDAANSSLESSVGKLEADGTATATITVQGKDTHGNKVGSGGATVVMETTLGTLSDVTDTGKGTYTATLTAGTETGTAEVSATLDDTAVSNILEIAFVEPVQGVDTGGSLASQGASVNVGAAFGAIVNAGANGGLSGGGGSAAPGGSSGGSSSGGSSSGSSSGSSDGTEAGSDDGIAYNRGDYGRLYVFSARETDENVTLVDWFTWGVSDASVDAELTGDGTYGYALVGKEMFKSRRAVVGLLYGAETSRWNYEGESDVDRVGVSLGFYAGRRFGDLTLNGSVIVTESNSEFLSTSGAEGKGDSNRIMVTSSLRGQQRLLENGATVTPLFNLLLAEEEMEAFTYDDGTVSEAGTSSIGRISGGLEYLTAPNARDTRYLVRGELGQVFGTDTVTLSDGTEYTPNEEVSGSLTFGWLPAPNDDTQARIELTFGEIGNDDNEEVRLEGTWDRNF